MKRISLLLAALTFGLGTHAQAWTGGPFDNGDYSILIERGGVYQCTFSFSNGSGMAMFNENNSFEPASATTVTGMFSINNRSVFYYKGVTYYGTATGIVDVDARRVTGFTNGSSDYSAGTSAVSANPQAGTASSRINNISYNGNLGYVANSTFTAKINATRPALRFRGSGTVTFMGFPQTEDLRTVLQNLINDLTAAPTIPTTGTPPPTTAQAANAAAVTEVILNYITRTTAEVDNPSSLQAYQESHKMRVFGSRRFF